MTATELLVAFIFMAVAVATILVGGTLGAAGLLHRPRRHADGGEGSDGRDRGPSLAGRPRSSTAVDPDIDDDTPPRGRAA